MNTPNTIESSVLETVSGGWHRHRHWHHGARSRVVVNNYWGAQPVQASAQTNGSFSVSMQSSF